MADAAAKRRLEFQAQENHEKRGSDETMEFDNSAVVRLRRSEEVIAELKGKVQILSAESLRSNERWGNAVRENKLLMSRLELVMAHGVSDDVAVEHQRQALQQREAQLKVAQRALQAARQDAGAIAESLNVRERSIRKMEKSWELLATTVTAVEQRMQLLSDFSSQNVQHSAHLVAALQARLGVLEPECQIFHSKLQELQSENQALKLAHNTRLESLQTVSQAQQHCLEVSLNNAKSSQEALRESAQASRQECNALRLALSDIAVAALHDQSDSGWGGGSKGEKGVDVQQVLALEIKVLLQQLQLAQTQLHQLAEEDVLQNLDQSYQQQQQQQQNHANSNLMVQVQNELQRSAQVASVLAERCKKWETSSRDFQLKFQHGEKRAVAAEEEMANIHDKLMSVLNKSATLETENEVQRSLLLQMSQMCSCGIYLNTSVPTSIARCASRTSTIYNCDSGGVGGEGETADGDAEHSEYLDEEHMEQLAAYVNLREGGSSSTDRDAGSGRIFFDTTADSCDMKKVDCNGNTSKINCNTSGRDYTDDGNTSVNSSCLQTSSSDTPASTTTCQSFSASQQDTPGSTHTRIAESEISFNCSHRTSFDPSLLSTCGRELNFESDSTYVLQDNDDHDSFNISDLTCVIDLPSPHAGGSGVDGRGTHGEGRGIDVTGQKKTGETEKMQTMMEKQREEEQEREREREREVATTLLESNMQVLESVVLTVIFRFQPFLRQAEQKREALCSVRSELERARESEREKERKRDQERQIEKEAHAVLNERVLLLQHELTYLLQASDNNTLPAVITSLDEQDCKESHKKEGSLICRHQMAKISELASSAAAAAHKANSTKDTGPTQDRFSTRQSTGSINGGVRGGGDDGREGGLAGRGGRVGTVPARALTADSSCEAYQSYQSVLHQLTQVLDKRPKALSIAEQTSPVWSATSSPLVTPKMMPPTNFPTPLDNVHANAHVPPPPPQRLLRQQPQHQHQLHHHVQLPDQQPPTEQHQHQPVPPPLQCHPHEQQQKHLEKEVRDGLAASFALVLLQEVAEVQWGLAGYLTMLTRHESSTGTRLQVNQHLAQKLERVQEPLDVRVYSLSVSISSVESVLASLCTTLTQGVAADEKTVPIECDIRMCQPQSCAAASRVLEMQQVLHRTAWAAAKARCCAIKSHLDHERLLQEAEAEKMVARQERDSLKALLLKFHAASAPLVVRFKHLHTLVLDLQQFKASTP